MTNGDLFEIERLLRRVIRDELMKKMKKKKVGVKKSGAAVMGAKYVGKKKK